MTSLGKYFQGMVDFITKVKYVRKEGYVKMVGKKAHKRGYFK